MTSPSHSPSKPTAVVVSRQLSKWRDSDVYQTQDRALWNLFNKHCPYNTGFEDVLLKVSVLNDFYSTNIFDTYSVAKHILELQIDSRLAAGDLGVVNDVASTTIKSKKKYFYSFASKFCSNHRPEVFPIYDSYVDKMLSYFGGRDRFFKFTKSELRDYRRFVPIVQAFRSHYRLTEFSLREIDTYLWLEGKRCFTRANPAA